MNQEIDNVQTVFHKQLSSLDLSSIDIQHTQEFDSAIALLESDDPCIFITGEALHYNPTGITLGYEGFSSNQVSISYKERKFDLAWECIRKIKQAVEKSNCMLVSDYSCFFL